MHFFTARGKKFQSLFHGIVAKNDINLPTPCLPAGGKGHHLGGSLFSTFAEGLEGGNSIWGGVVFLGGVLLFGGGLGGGVTLTGDGVLEVTFFLFPLASCSSGVI